jgi:hypothetical protein
MGVENGWLDAPLLAKKNGRGRFGSWRLGLCVAGPGREAGCAGCARWPVSRQRAVGRGSYAGATRRGWLEAGAGSVSWGGRGSARRRPGLRRRGREERRREVREARRERELLGRGNQGNSG